MKDDFDEDRKISLVSHVSKNDIWIIVCGYSHHIIGDKSKFEKLEHYNGSCVKFGNDAPCYVKGKGSIILNDKIRCDNAYWVDGLKYNLLSVAQLNSSGYQVEFHHKQAKIFNATSELIGSGKQTRCNFLYVDLSKDTCLFAQFEDSSL